MIYITADHHFNHHNIIKHCNRPFKNIDEMSKVFISKWNSVVTNRDTVYYLGDLIWNRTIDNIWSKHDLEHYFNFKQLFIIPGNHDKISRDFKRDKVKVLPPIYELNYNKKLYVLCHYPLETWNKKHYSSIHLHGHSHGKSRKMENRFDVGVDNYDYRPIPISFYLNMYIANILAKDSIYPD